MSEALVTSALDTVRVFGGYGLMAEYEVERSLRDAIAGAIYSGTNDMQRNIATRWLGLSGVRLIRIHSRGVGIRGL